MSGPVSNLPKAGVRLAPMPHGLVGVTSDHRPRLRVQLLAGAHEGPERVDNPAGHVQLNLIGGQGAQADWPAPLIPGQPPQLALARDLAAINPVQPAKAPPTWC